VQLDLDYVARREAREGWMVALRPPRTTRAYGCGTSAKPRPGSIGYVDIGVHRLDPGTHAHGAVPGNEALQDGEDLQWTHQVEHDQPADRIAGAALRGADDSEEAIERLVRDHVARGAVGGFVTGVGYVTLPVALSVKRAEFYEP
jgi:hypothetical protein